MREEKIDQKMGKGSKARKAEEVGKGKVSPVQVALIVERYLSDNNYSNTLSLFRSEASLLIFQAKGKQLPKGLLSLDAMLDEYICLKGQKVILDQEKSRVEKLLRGMQNVMQAYSMGEIISPPMAATMTPAPHTGPRNGLPATGNPSYNTPTASLAPMLPSPVLESINYSTPIANLPFNNKRKASRLVSDGSPAVKNSCMQLTANPPLTTEGPEIPSKATNTITNCQTVRQFSAVQSTSSTHTAVHGSSIAKSLFKQPHQSQTPCPKTPPLALPSQSDKSVSPPESSSLVHSTNSSTSQENTVRCHIISSETFVSSPFKCTNCYSTDGRHSVLCSPKSSQKRLNKREHIKGRLDFNDLNRPMALENVNVSSLDTVDEMSEIFDIDLSTFDALGTDFSLSELLDIDLEGEETCPSFQQPVDPSIDLNTGSKHESGNGGSDSIQASSEPSSSAKAVLCGRDTNRQGPDSLTLVKSMTQSIKIVSPVKNRCSSSSEKEN